MDNVLWVVDVCMSDKMDESRHVLSLAARGRYPG
jgi:hypothetical protein